MKRGIILAVIFLGSLGIIRAQETISAARALPVGTVVTVKGIVTNGPELGIIRYFQDNTAGIAAYGSITSSAQRGDSVTITGTLKNYNQLLELDPTTNVTIRSSGNPVPSPIVLTPLQISEPYEAMLVQVNNVLFTDAGTVFTGNKKYQFTANGETGYIYVKTSQTDIVGQIIPSSPVRLTAICSQFDYADPDAGYQLLPRTISDFEITSSIYYTNVLENTNFTQNALDFFWSTNIEGTTEIFYGLTEETVTANYLLGEGGSTDHEMFLTGLSAGQIYWVQAFSVSGSDTAFSGVTPFATISNSTGDIKVYFNTAVDTDYSNGVDAIYLPQTVDDTLIKYIQRAKYSIDLTMYNFNNAGISNVSDALKAAANRGLVVRVIGDGTAANLGMDELAGSSVHVLIGPADHKGIMHNKFILFDTESANQNDPLVWTGSTNLTDGQINTDPNNVIIIQDQSLARGYKIEFDEMWGSHDASPNSALSAFGSNKRNNTPHVYRINGKLVQSFFSPTDGVNARIVETINTANTDLSIATMLITRTVMSDAIVARKTAGVAVNVLTNSAGQNDGNVNTALTNSLGTHFTFDDVMNGIMHHKYMIVDQGAPASDPIVFTGSHNWSASADNENDENTLIVHDATLANIYYQNFVKRFVENDGVLFELTGPPTAVADNGQTHSDQNITFEVLANDIKEAPVSLEILTQPSHGSAFIPFSNPNVITYDATDGYVGSDSFTYKIAYLASPDLNSTTTVTIEVGYSDVKDILKMYRLVVVPNPVVNDVLSIDYFAPFGNETGFLQVIDNTGKEVYGQEVRLNEAEGKLNIQLPAQLDGLYFVRLSTSRLQWNSKIIVK